MFLKNGRPKSKIRNLGLLMSVIVVWTVVSLHGPISFVTEKIAKNKRGALTYERT